MPDLRLHIGPHKTATTRLQACLNSKSDALETLGVTYAGPDRFRRLLGAEFRKAASGRIDTDRALKLVQDRLNNRFWQSPLIIGSHENCVGGAGDVVSRPGPGYPWAAARLAFLRRLFAGYDTTLYLSVRSYDHLLNSAYSEFTRDKGDLSPGDVAAAMIGDHIRWPEFIDRIATAWPNAPIRIWQHQDYRENEGALLSNLTSAPKSVFNDLPVADYRPALSATAVDAILAARCFTDLKTYKARQAFSTALSSALPVTPTTPAIDIWNADQRAILRRRYDDDLKVLRATQGLEFLI